MVRRLGVLLHKARNGYLVARLETDKPPPLGVKVYDSSLQEIGVLLDVIGPVEQPYAVIKPNERGEKLDKKGVTLYYEPPRPRRPRRRRGRGAGRRPRQGRGRPTPPPRQGRGAGRRRKPVRQRGRRK
ncbi:MAG: RNA-binding protein [Crenarchaeota archaeon]|nr:RNA-binding protein [Thermoproteota archaeon]